jgi:hypothetical protein
VSLFDSSFHRNVVLAGNTDSTSLWGVCVDDNLICEGNDPAPTLGLFITAGSASGQCSLDSAV